MGYKLPEKTNLVTDTEPGTKKNSGFVAVTKYLEGVKFHLLGRPNTRQIEIIVNICQYTGNYQKITNAILFYCQ